MTKILLFLTMGLSLFAHSQVPIVFGGEKNKFDSISLSETKIVPITIQNLNSFKQKYLISVNNKVIGNTPFLSSNQMKKIKNSYKNKYAK
jgi:hypothetical protein